MTYLMAGCRLVCVAHGASPTAPLPVSTSAKSSSPSDARMPLRPSSWRLSAGLVTSSPVVKRSSSPASGASPTSTVKTTSSSRRRSVSYSAYYPACLIEGVLNYRNIVLTRFRAETVPTFNTSAPGATLRITSATSYARRRAVADEPSPFSASVDMVNTVVQIARAMDPLMSEPHCCYKDFNLLVGHQPLTFKKYSALFTTAP